MRLLYSALLYLVTPLVLLRLLWRGVALRDYWRRIPERFGFVTAAPDGVAVWVHAVSVGEFMAALPLVRRLIARHAPHRILVTTTTPTGSARVRDALGGQVLHSYAPYDLPHVVARFVGRMRPRQVVVMETELWPNLYRALARRGVSLTVANARLSPRSFAGYSRVRGFTSATLRDCTRIAAQSEADAERFRALGADPARVAVTGNLKFDVELPEALLAQGTELRGRLGRARPVWIAASTHDGEEEVALTAHRILRKRFAEAVLILVPRHPQRFDAVARLVERSGLEWARRTADGGASVAVYVGDSMGELPMYLAAADVAFVGGSFVDVGGHNVLEPAALGLPVLTGPQMYNFVAARDLLVAAGAARQLEHALELAPAVSALLADPATRAGMGRAGQQAVAANRGALDRLLRLLDAGEPGGA